MGYEITGIIDRIGDEQSVTERMRKRTVVITIDADTQYPQTIGIEAVNDRCDLLDLFAPGEKVTANIDIRGRDWTNPQGEVKNFVSLNLWKIDRIGPRVEGGEEVPPGSKADTSSSSAPADDDSEDLPF